MGRKKRGKRRAGSGQNKKEFPKDLWSPNTNLGRKVKSGEITDIADILESGHRIMEAEIVDILLPNLDSDFILIGQAKGKFGGGKRRIFRQTQKKTREGNKSIFTVMAVVGNRDGYVGVGIGRSKQTVPARDKAKRNAKLNIFQIARGCGSWQCACGGPHSVPFEIGSRESGVEIKLMPAPKGTGLVVDSELRKILSLAGVKDVWSKTRGKTKQTINLVSATIKALKQGTRRKVVSCNIKYGSVE